MNEVKWKPQSVKGNRALAIAYVDSRTIQERLDDVMGVENWQDEYEILTDGSVMCRLKLRLGGEWVVKADVGSPSEQPDSGDRLKAAVSDALKRAAVKYGIGRYLYRLPAVWCDYDPMRKQFSNQPQLPAWAIPGPEVHTGQVKQNGQAKPVREKPKNGTELLERMREGESKLFGKNLCKAGELISHVQRMCKAAKWPEDLTKLNQDGIDFAIDVATAFIQDRTPKADTPANPPPVLPAGSNKPNGASLSVREGILNTLRQRMAEMKKAFNDEPDQYLDRMVHPHLTMADLETSRPDEWSDAQISQIADEVDGYVKGGVPY